MTVTRRAVTGARHAVKVASAAADRWRAPTAGVVVLLYHRVGGGSALEIDLDVARFDEQIAAVAATGRSVSLGDALSQLAAASSSAPIPPIVHGARVLTRVSPSHA